MGWKLSPQNFHASRNGKKNINKEISKSDEKPHETDMSI